MARDHLHCLSVSQGTCGISEILIISVKCIASRIQQSRCRHFSSKTHQRNGETSEITMSHTWTTKVTKFFKYFTTSCIINSFKINNLTIKFLQFWSWIRFIRWNRNSIYGIFFFNIFNFIDSILQDKKSLILILITNIIPY